MALLKTEIAARQSEIATLRSQLDESIKAQTEAEERKLDEQIASQQEESKKYMADLEDSRKKIEELKTSLSDNKKRQEELQAQAVSEAQLKLKAEEEKERLEVLKHKLCCQAISYAVMRGRQNKLIAESTAEQAKLQQAIDESSQEIT